MIELKNVSFRYPLSDTESLKNFSLSIKKGECVLLCGRSGCGKTTVTKLVNGIIPYLADGDKTGNVMIKGTPIGEIPMYQLSKITGSVFQNPKSQFFNLDTDSELVFALENQGIPTEKIRARLEEVTEKLGIFKLRNRGKRNAYIREKNFFPWMMKKEQRWVCGGCGICHRRRMCRRRKERNPA